MLKYAVITDTFVVDTTDNKFGAIDYAVRTHPDATYISLTTENDLLLDPQYDVGLYIISDVRTTKLIEKIKNPSGYFFKGEEYNIKILKIWTILEIKDDVKQNLTNSITPIQTKIEPTEIKPNVIVSNTSPNIQSTNQSEPIQTTVSQSVPTQQVPNLQKITIGVPAVRPIQVQLPSVQPTQSTQSTQSVQSMQTVQPVQPVQVQATSMKPIQIQPVQIMPVQPIQIVPIQPATVYPVQIQSTQSTQSTPNAIPISTKITAMPKPTITTNITLPFSSRTINQASLAAIADFEPDNSHVLSIGNQSKA